MAVRDQPAEDGRRVASNLGAVESDKSREGKCEGGGEGSGAEGGGREGKAARGGSGRSEGKEDEEGRREVVSGGEIVGVCV